MFSGSSDEKTFYEFKTVIINYLAPKPTILAERFKFHQMQQKPGEITQNFLMRLRNTDVRCKFDAMAERLGDQFIFGISNVSAREALIEETISMI